MARHGTLLLMGKYCSGKKKLNPELLTKAGMGDNEIS
jgi:hypothetical protein